MTVLEAPCLCWKHHVFARSIMTVLEASRLRSKHHGYVRRIMIVLDVSWIIRRARSIMGGEKKQTNAVDQKKTRWVQNKRGGSKNNAVDRSSTV